MNAPIFGMTMLDSEVPNFCTCTRAPMRGAASVEVPTSGQLTTSDLLTTGNE